MRRLKELSIAVTILFVILAVYVWKTENMTKAEDIECEDVNDFDIVFEVIVPETQCELSTKENDDLWCEYECEEVVINYDPNTHTITSSRNAEDSIEIIFKTLMEYFVSDKYDFNEPITVKFTEPNEQSVDIPEYKGDPNEKTDIWTLYHSGKIFDDYADPNEPIEYDIEFKDLVLEIIKEQVKNMISLGYELDTNAPDGEIQFLEPKEPKEPKSILAQLIESIPTWPEYYEVKEDVEIAIERPESDDPHVRIYDMCITIEKGTRIYKVEKP